MAAQLGAPFRMFAKQANQILEVFNRKRHPDCSCREYTARNCASDCCSL
jgi:hypothetical protein